VSPKSHGMPRRIIGATMIWKINHRTDQVVAGRCVP
jgi:hypothetical protein